MISTQQYQHASRASNSQYWMGSEAWDNSHLEIHYATHLTSLTTSCLSLILIIPTLTTPQIYHL